MEIKREIIFRAWHKGIKAMLYPPSSIDSMTLCRDSKGKHRSIKVKSKKTKQSKDIPLDAHMTWDGRWYVAGKYQDVVWMQYTGQKDMNGKPIFEGDILLLHTPKAAEAFRKGKIPYVVSYYVDGFGVHTMRSANNFNQQLIWGTPKRINYTKWKNTEIIGNIYEHPKLLNK